MLEVYNKVEATARDTDNPYLNGYFAPMDTEYIATTDTLQVIGEIPKDLHGIYVRNSHNQVKAPLGHYHPFDGDGMVHAIHFKDGKAEYRNRFVRTVGFLAEQAAGKSLWPGILEPHLATYRGWGAIGAMKDNAGVDAVAHNGKLIVSMSNCGEPYVMDPITLETEGVHSWGQKLNPFGISSHYKVDLKTGDMMFFNFGEQYPYMNYGVVDRNNNLVHYVPVELPGARWPHDMGITQNYTILHDLSMFFDPILLSKGIRKLSFFPNVPSRFGIIPRFGDNSQIRWFEATPCYILHISNSYEVGDEVIMDGCISTQPHGPDVGQQGGDVYEKIARHLDKHTTQTHMYRWRFNLRTGKTIEECIDDEVTEFPVVSNDYVGYQYRYSYNTLFKKGDWLFAGLKKYDLFTGNSTRYEYGDNRYGSEPQIARRPGATEEDDGYLINIITDLNENRSECVIFDAQDIAAGPIATIILPERVNNGTHGCWVEGDRIGGER
ncbi:carotenoid oxygenase family protein [Bacillus sp. FJAT-29814]|uniref:carotenoid oxygenase family protein n=1 Tax=Bacillus sp. FJAT-29814 TaxID=1729688 RepID=UPI00082ACA82|nr:carotenoid oxygenase family protein [Bacillus sp. FJAT-29814]